MQVLRNSYQPADEERQDAMTACQARNVRSHIINKTTRKLLIELALPTARFQFRLCSTKCGISLFKEEPRLNLKTSYNIRSVKHVRSVIFLIISVFLLFTNNFNAV